MTVEDNSIINHESIPYPFRNLENSYQNHQYNTFNASQLLEHFVITTRVQVTEQLRFLKIVRQDDALHATGNLNLNREDFRLPTVEPIFFLINIFNQDPLSSSVYRLCRFSVAVTVRLELDARETRCTHTFDRKPGYVERHIKKRVRDRKRDLINARGKLYV